MKRIQKKERVRMIHLRLRTRKTPKGEIKCPIGGSVKPELVCIKCAYDCLEYKNYQVNKNRKEK